MKTGTDRKYTPAFRDAAVKQVDAGRGVTAVARSLEMSPKSLANWVYRSRRGQALDKRKAAATPMTELEAENSQLRQEVKKLRLEKEILKNAAAYFARELA
jgi:transposase